MNNTVKLVIALAVGAALATAVNKLAEPEHEQMPSAEKKPLYWVAPMDSNYRRDEPGLSPMGMELVPVYEEQSSAEDSPGTVRISPAVVNNLGVRTAPVRFKSLQTTVDTVGYVQYDQDQLVHIHPRVEGWIETLYVKAAGDQVKQGEPLYTLYSPQLVNAQEELLLALKRNNAVLIRAAKARLASLNVSDDFIARLEQSQKVRQNITFYAKQSGVLDELNIREGFFVQPGTTLMSIGSLEDVWVEARDARETRRQKKRRATESRRGGRVDVRRVAAGTRGVPRVVRAAQGAAGAGGWGEELFGTHVAIARARRAREPLVATRETARRVLASKYRRDVVQQTAGGRLLRI